MKQPQTVNRDARTGRFTLTRELAKTFLAVEGLEVSSRMQTVVDKIHAVGLAGTELTSAQRREMVKAALAKK